MKKILLLLVLFFVINATYSQKVTEYQVRISKMSTFYIPNILDAQFGYRVLPQLRIGGGVGAGYTVADYKETYRTTSFYYYNEYHPSRTNVYNNGTGSWVMPVFANLKYNFLEKKFSPYAQIDLGYNLPLESNENVTFGFFTNISAGVDWNLKHGALSLELGYNINSLTWKLKDEINAYSSTTYEFPQSYGLHIGISYIFRITKN